MTGYPSIDKPWLQYYNHDVSKVRVENTSVYAFFMQQNPPLDSIALDYFGNTVTYKQVIKNIDIEVEKFISLGIKKGDIVTLCSPTVPEVFYIFFALNKIGAIVNLLDPRLDRCFIEKNIDESNSCVVIYTDAALNKFRNIKANSKIKQVFYLPASNSLPNVKRALYDLKNRSRYKKIKEVNHKNWCSFVSEHDCELRITPNALSDDVAAIVYTSGTTELPKGALLSNVNIISLINQNSIADYGWDRFDRFLEIMPPFIAYGLLCGILIPMCRGMCVIIKPKFEQDKFADWIKKHQPNHIMGVPSMMEELMKDKKLGKADLSFLKTVVVGGDKINIANENAFNAFLKAHNSNVNLTKGYGMTEMTSCAVFTINEKSNLDGSVGIPLLGNNVKIINTDGKENCFGELGEICLTGPTLIQGYFNNQELTEKVFIIEKGERWIHTGDFGYMNQNGVLFVEGRIKRMIIRYDGFKVIPRLIEDVISLNENIQSCAVVGIDDSMHGQGQLPLAYAVLKSKDNKDDLKKSLLKQCADNLPEYEQPVDILFIDELPLTSVGKVDYLALENNNR